MLWKIGIIVVGVLILGFFYQNWVAKKNTAIRNIRRILKRMELYGYDLMKLKNLSEEISLKVAIHPILLGNDIQRIYNLLPETASEDDRLAFTAVLISMRPKDTQGLVQEKEGIYHLRDINRAKLIAYLCYIAPIGAIGMWKATLTYEYNDPALYQDVLKELQILKQNS